MLRSIFLIMIILSLFSISIQTSLAQNENCSLQAVISSFEKSVFSNNLDGWVKRYSDGECERQIINGTRTLATVFKQLSNVPFGTTNDPCSQFALLESFKAAVLSGEADSWLKNYSISTCSNEVKHAANALSQGYLELIGKANSRIAFMSNEEGNYEIYTINEDGTEVDRLTRNDGFDGRPDWSPDGTKIAFVTNRDRNNEIYAMSSNGRTQRRLTNNTSDDRFPIWSPDGNQILFDSNRDGDYEIYVMRDDGSNQFQLTHNTNDDYWASWSPNGKSILFSSGDNIRHDIYIMDTDGSNSRRLTTDPANDIDPTFSPDGMTIAFISNRTGTYELYFMNADGSDEHLISLPDGDKFHPDWNRSGTQLVIMVNANRPVSRRGDFSVFDDGGWELYHLNVVSNDYFRITDNNFDESDPDWGI